MINSIIKSASNAISSELISKKSALPFDDKIIDIIQSCEKNDSCCQLTVLIKNRTGDVYRTIQVTGMNTFISLTKELNKLPLVDLRRNEICFDNIHAEYIPA